MTRRCAADERFRDPYNMGVNAESYLYDPAFDDAFLRRSSLISLLRREPARSTSSEMTRRSSTPASRGNTTATWRGSSGTRRHAMMGEAGFVSLGIDWAEIPVNFTWSQGLNAQLAPIERHAVLYFIEQGLMPKTGKRYEWRSASPARTRSPPSSRTTTGRTRSSTPTSVALVCSRCESPRRRRRFRRPVLVQSHARLAAVESDGLTEHRN
ncbi:MAG: hypothetical protein R3F11_26875 [Verrucomicrobiales bacterium]